MRNLRVSIKTPRNAANAWVITTSSVFTFFFTSLSAALAILRRYRTNFCNNKTTCIIIIHQIFSLARDWSKRVTWLNIPRLKLANIQLIFSNFQNCACCEKYLKDNKHNSLHLARKLTIFLELRSREIVRFSEQTMSRGQISEHIFAPNRGYCLH